MNILSLHNKYLIQGGEDISVQAQISMMRENGHKVLEYNRSNFEIASENKIKTAVNTIYSRKSALEIKKIIKEDNINLIESQNIFPLISPSVYYASRDLGVPIVQYLRNYRLICPNALLFKGNTICEKCVGQKFPIYGVKHKCYKESHSASLVVSMMLGIHNSIGTFANVVDHYVVLTEFMKKKFVESGFSPDRISVKPNFMENDPGYQIKKSDYYLYVGRLSTEKGVSTLLEAFSYLTEKRLLLVGDGPLKEKVCKYSIKYPNIEYIGKKNYEDVLFLIKNAKAVIFPSEWLEPFGRIFIESFSTGTPVISSNIESIKDMVDEGKNGLHFKVGDVLDLLKTVNNYESLSKANRKDFSIYARDTYNKYYTKEVNYKKTVELYENIYKKKVIN
jgi:glycosyltransferase involved in cell wall biosynthesis